MAWSDKARLAAAAAKRKATGGTAHNQSVRQHLAIRLKEARGMGLKGMSAYKPAFQATAYNLGDKGLRDIVKSRGSNTTREKLVQGSPSYNRQAMRVGQAMADNYVRKLRSTRQKGKMTALGNLGRWARKA